MTNPDEARTAENTDRELWREPHPEGDAFSYYAPSIHVTAAGGIGINVGGTVWVKTLRDWHALADRAARLSAAPDLSVRPDLYDAVGRVHDTLGFFASCIKSGESWSDSCEEALEATKAALVTIRAASTPSPAVAQPVAVKSLVWGKTAGSDYARAPAGLGREYVTYSNGPGRWAWGVPGESIEGAGGSEAEVQAAAQAHYDSIIRSALADPAVAVKPTQEPVLADWAPDQDAIHVVAKNICEALVGKQYRDSDVEKVGTFILNCFTKGALSPLYASPLTVAGETEWQGIYADIHGAVVLTSIYGPTGEPLRLQGGKTAGEAIMQSQKEFRDLFDLRYAADMRAIKRWQEAHPGNDLTWPDHTDLIVWLMEALAALRSPAAGEGETTDVA